MSKRHRTREQWIRWLRSTLLISFYYSCLVHVVVLGLWKLGILELPDQLVSLFVKRKNPAQEKVADRSLNPTNAVSIPKEIPLAFIEVEPDQASATPPKDVRFYSQANSVAANPEPRKETPMPKSDGKQERMAKLRDVPRAVLPPPPPPTPQPASQPAPQPKPQPPPPQAKPEPTLQPAPPKANVIPIPTPEPPKPTPPKQEPLKPTEVAAAKEPKPADPVEPLATQAPVTPAPAAPPKTRPKNLAQARQQSGIAGEQMKQDGGVRRPGKLAVDAKATPFGEYDAALIRAVQERWYYLLDNAAVSARSGKVVLQFNLKFDGTVTDLKVRETEVGEVLALLCERAVSDPSPYPRWPLDMHRLVGGNIRPVTFTFLYY